MTVSRFTNGNYVVHHIRLPWHASWYSAWFAPDGTLLDCERRVNHRSYEIPASWRKTRDALQRVGSRYREGN